MSWFRLDDQGAFHAKVVKAGNEAYGAWCRAGQWCSAHGSTGFIPIEVAHLLASKKIWDRALSCGLLDKTDGAGYQIHDFNEYNPTEEQVDARKARLSAARSAAGKTGGIKSGVARSGLPSGPSNGEANAKQTRSKQRSKHEAKRRSKHEAKRSPVPSRPVPWERRARPPVCFDAHHGRTRVHRRGQGHSRRAGHHRRLRRLAQVHWDGFGSGLDDQERVGQVAAVLRQRTEIPGHRPSQTAGAR